MAVRAQSASENQAQEVALPRRSALMLTALSTSLAGVEGAQAGNSFEAGDGAQVEMYLPKTDDGYYTYKVKTSRTPALRAEAVDPYQFDMPAGWKEQPVSNAISGNYCQPRCDEPTTEVKFSSPSQGSLQVIIAPLTKLTRDRSNDPPIDTIGDLAGVLASIGPYITGAFVAEEDVASMKEIVDEKKRKYFVYELNSPYALNGTRSVSCVSTSKTDLVMIVVSCSERQWNTAGVEEKLRRTAESFRVVPL